MSNPCHIRFCSTATALFMSVNDSLLSNLKKELGPGLLSDMCRQLEIPKGVL